MARLRTRWALLGAVAVVALTTVTMTGCSAVDERDVSDRLAAAADLNGAIVEIQHPGAPWNNKYVVWMFVGDGTATAVASDVRRVAAFADADEDLSGQDLTLFAVVGQPDEYADGSFRLSAVDIMGSVSEIVGGKGVEDTLTLTAADVARLADGQ